MDAGTAAIIGALTGAAASIVVTVIDRIVGIAQARTQLEVARRTELRDVLLEHHRVLVELTTGTPDETEWRALALAEEEAYARLELLIDRKNELVISMALDTGRAVIDRNEKAKRFVSAYLVLSSAWFRGSLKAEEALDRFRNNSGLPSLDARK